MAENKILFGLDSFSIGKLDYALSPGVAPRSNKE